MTDKERIEILKETFKDLLMREDLSHNTRAYLIQKQEKAFPPEETVTATKEQINRAWEKASEFSVGQLDFREEFFKELGFKE